MNFGWMKWHTNDRMTFKWQNDIQMMEWNINEVFRFRFKSHEWPLDEWNGIQMTELHSNDGMIQEWGF